MAANRGGRQHTYRGRAPARRAAAPSRRRKKRRRQRFLLAAVILLAFGVALFSALRGFGILPKRYYKASDFGIETLQSPYDANGNGVDDYTDILLGARQDAKNCPTYDPAYYEGGYPPETSGVCADVIWRALQNAGYDLKALMDADIAAYPEAYPRLDDGIPDPNIDFRRVKNQHVYFSRYATPLTLDITDIAGWQPGDIVIFDGKTDHIGIISDRRNAEGTPWLIHNGGQIEREEDAFPRLLEENEIVGHYRWTGGTPLW